MLDMAETTYLLDNDGSAGSKEVQSYQEKDGQAAKLDWDTAVPKLKFVSVIPRFKPRMAVLEEKERKNRTRSGPIALQDAVMSTIETAVHWWHDPAIMAGWIMQQVPRWPHQSAKPTSFPVHELPNTSAEPVTIRPELRDNMETTSDARRRLGSLSYDMVCTHNPIRSEVEQDVGLAVLLTDQFQEVAYIL